MMQVFRNTAKPLIIAVTVTFFAWLVLDLSGLTGGGGLLTKTAVGKVNGKAIDIRAYQSALQQAVEARQRQGGAALTLEENEQLKDEVWEQFVQNVLLDGEYRKRGLVATPDEIADAIKNAPPTEFQSVPTFQTDGRFDLAKYQRWLTSSEGTQYLPALEQQYRDQILQAKLFRAITADVYVSDAALWQRYRDQNEKTTVGLAAIVPDKVVPDSAVAVTPAEVEAYFKAHRDEFTRKGRAYLSYVSLSRLADASDTAAARARAEAARTEIAGGAPFAEVARRESSDSVSAQKGGDLGEWTRGAFDPAFEAAAFSQPLNALSAPVLSQFGFHIIQVYERQGDKAKARHILIPIELSGAHRDLVDARADTLERLGAERLDPTALDTVSRALGLAIGQVDPVDQGTQARIGNLTLPDAGVWAFQAKVGEVSPVIETPWAFYLFRVDSADAAGVPELARVRGEVERAVRLQKKAERAKALAKELDAKVAAGTPLKAAAEGLGLPYQEFGPFARLSPPIPSPVVAGAAFGLAPGQRSAIITTKDGAYLLQGVSRQPADSAAFAKDLESLRRQTLGSARQQRVRGFLTALRESAKVEDDRKEIFRTSAQAEAAAPVIPGS